MKQKALQNLAPTERQNKRAKKSAPAAPTKRLPLVCKLIFLLSAVSALLYGLFRLNADFAQWFNQSISHYGRMLLATLTAWLPFSLAELLLITIPLWAVALIVIAVKHYSSCAHDALVFLGILSSLVLSVLILFVWNFAPGYYDRGLAEKLELNREKVSAEELEQTATVLTEQINALSDEITFLESGSSLMPYSYQEMNDKLLEAYERFCEKHSFMSTFYSRVKPVMLSEPMSYTHITGVYTFFTGEANINVNFPDYCIPYTAAHELAHQRGIAREDEANFIAFLVCMESDDAYIRYSALLNVYEYVGNALYSANKTLYRKVNSTLPEEVHAEEAAYSAFFEKYKENVVADVSQQTNNAYLQSQGNKEGSKSYNMVVDLAVAYYRAQNAK